MIKLVYENYFAEHYYKDLSKRKFKKYGYQTLEEIYKQKFEKYLECDLKTLLCDPYNKLLKIKCPNSHDEIKNIFAYQSKFQKHISNLFKKELVLHTCYYCNIDFINVFKTTNKNFKSGYTLDHIKPKSTFPHLALSLYNLVPSCYICNSKLKRDIEKLGDVSPTASNFNFDEKVKFKTFMANQNLQINKEDDFDLLLKEDFSDIYQKYIEVFELNGRYEYHKYRVLEMIQKRKEYPDSRIKELATLIRKTEEKVKQDLFGEYISQDKLHKRAFSKLTKDIAKELNLY